MLRLYGIEPWGLGPYKLRELAELRRDMEEVTRRGVQQES